MLEFGINGTDQIIRFTHRFIVRALHIFPVNEHAHQMGPELGIENNLPAAFSAERNQRLSHTGEVVVVIAVGLIQ